LGDSRAYRYRQGEFMQLSVDHTDAAVIKERGITNRRPRLTQYLGIDQQELILEPAISKGEIHKGDWYLLCSDGVTDMLSNFEIADIIHRAKNAEQCVTQIINAALEKGGRDNITAIVCRII
jgi:protein phosphatase